MFLSTRLLMHEKPLSYWLAQYEIIVDKIAILSTKREYKNEK